MLKTKILSLSVLGFAIVISFQACTGDKGSSRVQFVAQNSISGGNGDGYLGKQSLVAKFFGTYDPSKTSQFQSTDHFYRWTEGANCILSSVQRPSHSGHLFMSQKTLQYELDSCTPAQPAPSLLSITPFNQEVGVAFDLVFENSTSALSEPSGKGFILGYCRSSPASAIGFDVVVRALAQNSYTAEIQQGTLDGSTHSRFKIAAVPVQLSAGTALQFEGISQALEVSFERGLQARVNGRLKAVINGVALNQQMDCWSEFDTITTSQINTLGGGANFTIAGLPVGKTFAWGVNNSGQLGTTSTQSFLDKAVEVLFGAASQSRGIKEVSSYSSDHTCVITQNGDLNCWGLNGGGQIGMGSQGGIRNTPYLVRDHSVSPGAIEISVGKEFSAMTLAEGSIYRWGTMIGVAPQLQPSLLSGLPFPLRGVIHGAGFSCGIVQNGNREVTCWGDNSVGQLGFPSTVAFRLDLPVSDKKVLAPGGLESLSGVLQLVGSDYSICALLNSGRVVCWGDNRNGNLGESNGQYLPFYMDTVGQQIRSVASIHLGRNRGCAISDRRNVYCWGKNYNGELGRGVISSSTELAAESPLLSAMGFSDLHLGDTHSCGQFLNGRVFCWGNNSNGVTGIGISSGITLTPQEVLGLE